MRKAAAAWMGTCLVAAACGGSDGEDCHHYAKVTCERACACSADPGCMVVWGSQIYTTGSRTECEAMLGEVCEGESELDVGDCLEMVEATGCSGATFVHPLCPLGGSGSDGGGAGGPAILDLSAPERTPLLTAAVRGHTSNATRVVVGLSEDSQVEPVMPGGDFCVDVALPEGRVSAIVVHAISDSGAASAQADVEVAQEADAPEPPEPTCSGEQCAADEDCGNGVDDDCNALADECDSACNGCADDDLEPNDVPFAVPPLEDGSYDLDICPCREDWFAFELPDGGAITAMATFEHDAIDIDLQLFEAADAEMGLDNPVATSMTTNDSERIDYTATSAGTYYLRVYSFRTGSSGSYGLDIATAPSLVGVSSSSR